MHYVNVARIQDLPPGTCLSVDVTGDRDVALCNVDGAILALQNTCPHAGGPLGDGTLEGDVVRCPWHGWTFNVRTGQCLKNPVPAWSVTRYPTRVEHGIIQVACPPEPGGDAGIFGLDGATAATDETASGERRPEKSRGPFHPST